MVRQRGDIPTLPGRFVSGGAATGVNAFGRVTPIGVVRGERLDLSGYGDFIQRAAEKDAKEKAEADEAAGARFATESPEVIKDLNERLKALKGSEAGQVLDQLVREGVLPEDATPAFQRGLLQQQGRNAAAGAYNELLLRVPELGAIRNEDGTLREPEDVDAAIAKAFADVPDLDIIRSNRFSSFAFDAAATRATAEVQNRVVQTLSTNRRAEGRALFSQGVRSEIIALQGADDEEVDGHLAQLAQTLEDDGFQAGIQGVRSVLLDQIEATARDVADDSPEAALSFVTRAMRVQVGPVKIGDDTSDENGRGRLEQLRREIIAESDRKEAVDRQRRAGRQKEAVDRALDIGQIELLETLASGEPTDGAIERALDSIDQDEFIRATVLKLGEGEGIPAYIRDAVRADLEDLRDRTVNNQLRQSDPEFLGRLERGIQAGADPSVLLGIARDYIGADGGITPADYRNLKDRLGRGPGAASSDLRKDLPEYDIRVRQPLGFSGDTFTFSGFSSATQDVLVTERGFAADDINAILDDAVANAGEDDNARKQAFVRALGSPEVRERVSEFTSMRLKAEEVVQTAVAEADALIRSFDLDEAQARLQSIGRIASPNTVAQLRAAIDQQRDTRDRQALSFYEGNRYSLLQELNALVAGRPEAQAILSAADAELSSLVSAEAPRIFKETGAAGANRVQAVRDYARSQANLILDRYRPTVAGEIVATPESLAAAEENARISESEFAWNDYKLRRGSAASPRRLADLARPGRLEIIPQGAYEGLLDLGTRAGSLNPLRSTASIDNARRRAAAQALVRVPTTRWGEAYVSLFSRDIIPAAQVLAGRAELNVSFLRNESAGLEDDLARQGADVTVTPGRTENGLEIITITGDIDLAGVKLSPFGVRYFESISDYDALSPADKTTFLTRLGIPQGDADFRAAQDLLIKDLQ